MGQLLRGTTTVLVTLILLQSLVIVLSREGLIIIATFQNIADDVGQLICVDDKVYALVPPGIDPHDYQLTPNDYELLSKADVIISTMHTHFELKIAELVRSGYLKSILIEIPNIAGINLLRLPNTDVLNYHAITYDPNNYLVFITNISNTLITLRPTCREDYVIKLHKVSSIVNYIKERVRNTNLSAVASSPLVQYAVRWLGIDIKRFAIKEHGISPLPADLIAIEELMKNRLVNVVIISEPSEESDRLLYDLALKYSLPVIKVPSYTLSGPIPTKLSTIVDQVISLSNYSTVGPHMSNYDSYDWLLQYIIITLTAIAVILSTLLMRRYLK